MFMLYLLYVLFFHEMCSVISEDESLLVGQCNTKCYKPGLFFLKKGKNKSPSILMMQGAHVYRFRMTTIMM